MDKLVEAVIDDAIIPAVDILPADNAPAMLTFCYESIIKADTLFVENFIAFDNV